jgi:hypothetical protein
MRPEVGLQVGGFWVFQEHPLDTRSDLPNREIEQVKLRDHSYKAFAIVPMDHG